MIFRVLFVLVVFLLVDARAQSGTYLRHQNFAAFPSNWKQTSASQFYGYEATSITGGTGAAGGLFLPGTVFNDYADLFLGGSLSRGKAISASGRLALKRVSTVPPYVTNAYIGHFGQPVGAFIDTIGIALIGTGDTTISAAAILEFANGSAYIGNWVTLPVGGDYLNWSYAWSPSGGRSYGSLVVQVGGQTSSLNLPASSAGLDFSLNAFGLYQPPFRGANGSTFLWAYIGSLGYTALDGTPPSLKVNAPQTIVTKSSAFTVSGQSRVAQGYKVASVRFRVNHSGKIGNYRTAKGTKNWTARVRVPEGRSRVEFVATSDSGLTKTVSRVVKR